MRKRILYCLFISSFGGPAWAEGDPSEIVVVASGDSQPLADTGQAVTVIGADEIARVQGPDVTRVLERVPGVVVSRNGAFGAFTGVRVRGAEAEQLLVLVDGVRVADSAAPAGGFDFGTLLPAAVSRIELLRGSNSTIWGSDAMGGVLAVETLGREGVAGSVEYGGPRALYAQGSAAGSAGALDYGLDAAWFGDRGISSAASGSEPDGLRQWQVGGRGRARLAEGLSAQATVRHVEARLDLDGFPPPDFTFADTAEYQDTRRTSASAGLAYAGRGLTLDAIWSLSDTARDSFDPAAGEGPTYTTRGRDQRAGLRGRWDFAGGFALHFGGERAWSRMATLSDPRLRTGSSAAYAQFGWRRGALALNAGLRAEDHDRFGSAWSFGADGALALGEGWRLRASYGEGFKAPTLFQLLSDYGNAALRPERSRAFDVAIEKGERDGPLYLSAGLFRRDSTDLIDFVSCFGETDGICIDRPYGTYDNVNRARAQGVELEAAAALGASVRLRGAYSYVEAVNRTPGAANEGRDLARRPRHAARLSADWSTPWALDLGADLRIVSRSFDDVANTVRLGGYALATLRASLPLAEHVELYGRIENLTDTDYQTAAGYGTPGRTAYIGARARW